MTEYIYNKHGKLSIKEAKIIDSKTYHNEGQIVACIDDGTCKVEESISVEPRCPYINTDPAEYQNTAFEGLELSVTPPFKHNSSTFIRFRNCGKYASICSYCPILQNYHPQAKLSEKILTESVKEEKEEIDYKYKCLRNNLPLRTAGYIKPNVIDNSEELKEINQRNQKIKQLLRWRAIIN